MIESSIWRPLDGFRKGMPLKISVIKRRSLLAPLPAGRGFVEHPILGAGARIDWSGDRNDWILPGE